MVTNSFYCKDISKNYDKEIALQKTSFYLNERDIIFILGHNGSGKSTILKIISGVIKTDSGYIKYNNNNNSNWQNYSYNQHIWIPQVIDEVLAKFVRIDEIASITNKIKLMELAKNINADWLIETINNKKKYKLICEFSGGQKQLLVGLIALSLPKKLLLMDEVFRSLDNKIINYYLNAVKDFIERNNGCALIVTHDLKFAIENATRLFILKNGKLIYDIPPSEISMEKLALEIANLN